MQGGGARVIRGETPRKSQRLCACQIMVIRRCDGDPSVGCQVYNDDSSLRVNKPLAELLIIGQLEKNETRMISPLGGRDFHRRHGTSCSSEGTASPLISPEILVGYRTSGTIYRRFFVESKFKR